MQKMHQKICANPDCGKVFETPYGKRKYCCQKCADEAHKDQARINRVIAKEKAFAKKNKTKYNTIDNTLKKCKESGISYAENQLRKTLSMVDKIILEI